MKKRKTRDAVGVVAVCIGLFGGLAFAPACGPDAKPVTYPKTDAGAGTPVTNDQGAQVGVVEGPDAHAALTGSAKESYDRGWKAWLEGDLQGAKKGFTEAGTQDAKSPAPHYSLGVVLERLGELSGAQQEYRTAFSLKPDHELAIGAYAMSLANSGHTSEADTFLAEKRSKAPNSPRIAMYSAEVKSIGKDHGTAQQLAQDALRLDPDFKDAMVTIARDHYRARKLDLAKYALQAILDGFGDASPPRDKDNGEAHMIRALIERELGQRALAMKDFEAARAKRPDLVEASIQLGSMKLEAGNAIEAQPLLESAIRFSPKSAIAHLNLGDCYRLLGRSADAKREFDAALSQDSSLAIAHYDIGLLYLTTASMPGTNDSDQVATAIKEFETYKTMRGKPTPGSSDDIDDLLNKAKQKQSEINLKKNASAAPTSSASASAAPTPSASASAAPKPSAAPSASAAVSKAGP